MTLAQEILKSLDDSFNRFGEFRGRSSTDGNRRWTMQWEFGERRLGDIVPSQVLTVKTIWVHQDYRRQGAITEFVTAVLEGALIEKIPLAYLNFERCNEDMARILRRQHFHHYQIGDRHNYWHAVTGQKELPL